MGQLISRRGSVIRRLACIVRPVSIMGLSSNERPSNRTTRSDLLRATS